jgi:choline dehydrogenase-like flavoprotein
MQDRGAEIMEAAGAQRVTRAPIREQNFSMHLLGTCRMGNDPRASVVDRYHRAHDIRNLFVCDGSNLVTSGRGQPTMTIQALAFRAADHIARFARAGDI